MIQDKYLTIGAGQELPVQGIGTFVGVLSVSDADQELQVRGATQGEVVMDARLLQGERLTISKKFDQLWVRNPGASSVAVVLLVGDGRFESGRLTGAISVPELTGSRLDSVGVVDRLASVEDIEPTDLTNAQSWIFEGADAALKTIVAPVSNVNGIRVHLAEAIFGNTSIMFKASAPSAYNDSAAVMLSRSYSSASNGYQGHSVARNMLIPAGMGLYAQSKNTTNAHVTHCLYEVL